MTTSRPSTAWPSVAHAATLGALCGARSMLPLVQLARAARAEDAPGRVRWLGRAAAPLALAAGGELVYDKLPGAGSRLAPPALVARCIGGAIAGATVFAAARRSALPGALVGAIAAAAGAWVTHRARVGSSAPVSARALQRRGAIEDVIVGTLAGRAARSAMA